MAKARSFCLLVAAVLITFSQNSVGFKFSFNGFKSQSDLFIVTSPVSNWMYNVVNESCYTLVWPPDKSVGRLLYPQAVLMREPGSSAVMSFSTTFIFQIYQHPVYVGKGSGFTFLMVPNNSTIGAPNDFLGLITTTTDTVTKDVASDEHTFGVEFDTFLNQEFNDPNDNHIGLDRASMNSSFSFKPTIPLTTFDETVYHQVWIDYDQAQSTMDIYLAVYHAGVVKPAVPSDSWPGVDLSLLSEPMFVGFSAAIGTEGADRHTIFAWSFSNEGEAPPIFLAKDAPPSGPSPPPPPGSRKPSPPPPRTPGDRNAEPPGHPPTQNLGLIIGVVLSVVFVSAILGFLLWLWFKFFACKLRIFLSNTGGGPENKGIMKNFPQQLRNKLVRKWWYNPMYRLDVFFDKNSIRNSEMIAERIKKELGRFEVGVVIVTREYFRSYWCLTELIAFMDAYKERKDHVRVWPLFYELKPEEVKECLTRGEWDARWLELSDSGPSHPLDVERARKAVKWLTKWRGLKYPSDDRDQDEHYIELIVKKMKDIFELTRSLKAGWDRIRRRPTPVQRDKPDEPLE